MRVLTVLLGLLPALLWAEVYKSVLPDGRVIYSDQPSEGATVLPITAAPPLLSPILVVPPTLQTESSPEVEISTLPAYQQIIVSSPEDEALVRDNAGNVALEVVVVPELLVTSGHRLVVELDGTRLDVRYPGNRLELANVDRGTHQVVVLVVDGSGMELLRSAPRRFHLQRHSIRFP